jgi:hypothetical protein
MQLRYLSLIVVVGFTIIFTSVGVTQPTYPSVTWRVQNQTKKATITEVGVVFTDKSGQVNTHPIQNVSVAPGGYFDVKSQDGPCFVRIEGVIRFVDHKGTLRGPMKKTYDEPGGSCIRGVRYMQLTN